MYNKRESFFIILYPVSVVVQVSYSWLV